MSMNLAEPLRAALMAAQPISSALGQWQGEAAVFTRRPVPGDAPSRFIIVNPDAAITNDDALNNLRPIIQRDIAVYGDQPADYRAVEAVGYAMQELFHRNRLSIIVPGYRVVGIVVSGPFPAPADDITQVGRMVSLSVSLEKLPT